MALFIQGIPKINLVKSATVGDGIWRFSESEINLFVTYFDKHKDKYTIEKFVPASGAATRMFKFLNEFLNEFDAENDTINSYIKWILSSRQRNKLFSKTNIRPKTTITNFYLFPIVHA